VWRSQSLPSQWAAAEYCLAGPGADVIHPRFLNKSHSIRGSWETRYRIGRKLSNQPTYPFHTGCRITPCSLLVSGLSCDKHTTKYGKDDAPLITPIQHTLQLHQEVDASALHWSITRWYLIGILSLVECVCDCGPWLQMKKQRIGRACTTVWSWRKPFFELYSLMMWNINKALFLNGALLFRLDPFYTR